MKSLLLLFVAVPVILSLTSGTTGTGFGFVRAEEDDVDDEMVDVEGEETAVTGEDAVEDDDTPDRPSGSPDAQTTILFTKPTPPSGATLELPGGVLVEFLVGFKNNGPSDFVIETLDASFRYPMDFNFYIQNFSTVAYERSVKPSQEATLIYSFIPAEAFAGRPFGLSINLRYRDLSGNQFYEGVYNETVNIIELDEGLDGETFFLYVFLGACGVLCLVLGQQFLVSVGKKRVGSSAPAKRQVETGTNDRDDVDYDWLPKETLQNLKNGGQPSSSKAQKRRKQRKGEVKDKQNAQNKSPKVSKSPKTSPKSVKPRKAKRAAGSDD